MTSEANQEQAEFWEETSVGWIEAEQHSRIVSQVFGEAAMDRLAAQAGERVLDIGCGTGDTTAALAVQLAPDGSALGVDIAPGMIAEAQRRHADVDNLSFTVADPQVDDLGGQRFDAAFSKFGVMFFSDPAAAFANIRTLLNPSGRLAFCCWRDVFSNEWMMLAGMAVMNVTGALPPMPGPGEPGPMSLADPDVVSVLLVGAGFTDVEITPLDHLIDQPESGVEAFVQMAKRIGPVGAALRESDDEHLSGRILASVRETLHTKVAHGRLQLASSANIVSARA